MVKEEYSSSGSDSDSDSDSDSKSDTESGNHSQRPQLANHTQATKHTAAASQQTRQITAGSGGEIPQRAEAGTARNGATTHVGDCTKQTGLVAVLGAAANLAAPLAAEKLREKQLLA